MVSHITNPFFRIARPEYESWSANYRYVLTYAQDQRYCSGRASLCQAFRLIHSDLERIFEYIEPCDSNKGVYSHRNFELLLRTATEFENNCKGILLANGYSGNPKDWKITDYFKIQKATKLSEYSVKLLHWRSSPIILKPFSTWSSSNYASLPWYKAYNEVKHNRDTEFSQSNLENLLNSVAGLLCVLVAQFGFQINPNRFHEGYVDLSENSSLTLPDSSMLVELPRWNPEDCYEFNWSNLSSMPNCFQQYSF